MSDFVALVPEAERQRLVLEEWLESAEFDLMENGCRLYKNFREHVQPLLEVMGFQVNRSTFEISSLVNY